MSVIIAGVVYQHGRRHALAEIELGNAAPLEVVLDESDTRTLAYTITGKKLEELSEDDVAEITAMYEEGYYDAWEDHLGS